MLHSISSASCRSSNAPAAPHTQHTAEVSLFPSLWIYIHLVQGTFPHTPTKVADAQHRRVFVIPVA
jgi:hypothetical protein